MGQLKRYEFRLTGETALLIHNVRLANPLDPIAQKLKELSARRKKTEEDYEELARWEFAGGMYLTPEKRPSIPNFVFLACLKSGARPFKLGKKLGLCLSVPELHLPLLYEGPGTWEELFELRDAEGGRPFVNQQMVRVQNNRVLRTRPVFQSWGLNVPVHIVNSGLTVGELDDVFEMAGAIGLCDGRSIGYGRFRAERVS